MASPESNLWKEARRLALQSKMNFKTQAETQAGTGPSSADETEVVADAPIRWNTVLNDAGRPKRYVDPLALPSNLAQNGLVRVVSKRPLSTRARKLRGQFCACFTTQNTAENSGQRLDTISRAISPSDFKAVPEHSGMSGRGVPYDSTLLSDFPCMWSCRQCGLCPQVDIADRLNRKRKRIRREMMAMRS